MKQDNSHQRFLEFEGTNIVFVNKEGQYWIAIKPICDVLNVNYNRQFQNLKKHHILSQLFAKQQTTGVDGKTYEMICLPEKYVYGWLFSINSKSEELLKYQETCYALLYDHFHGTITSRKELLLERKEVDTEIHELEEKMKEMDEKYKKLQVLKRKRKTLSTQLNTIDKELIQQPELFKN